MAYTVKNGYPGLAKFIGPNFDQGLGIFRQFAELNAQKLVYMQAEILCLEQELKFLTERDERGPDPTAKRFARSVWEMRRVGNSVQWAKILEIRDKLNDYNNCLLQQAQMEKLDRANKHDLKCLIEWLEHKEGGREFLDGCEFRAWDEVVLSDLISISNRSSNERFTRWLEEKLFPYLPGRLLALWMEPIEGSEKTGISRYNLKLLGRLIRVLNIILSATIPSVAVLALYFINNIAYRLVAVACFSGVFSLVLAVFTTARPVEIFAATAAFGSVQVVFVGGTSNVC